MSEAAHPSHKRPLWFAAILTCVALPVGFALLLALTSWRSGPIRIGVEFVGLLPLTLIFGLPIAALAMYLFALPLAMLFRARGWLWILPVCIADTIAGALAYPGFFLLVDHRSFAWGDITLGASFGLAAGVIFCLIAGIPWRPATPKVLIPNT